MLEILAGTGLAAAAGLNAYVPLLILGLAGRFVPFVHLPDTWAWLSNGWALVILAVLLVIEVVADKVPVVDSINDVIQTFIRPVAGGIVFGAGTTTQTAAIKDPAQFFSTFQWIPVIFGVFVALAVHFAKASARPVVNAASFGLAAPAVSAAEDVGSVFLSILAVLLPAIVIIAVIGVAIGFVLLFRRGRMRRSDEEKRLLRERRIEQERKRYRPSRRPKDADHEPPEKSEWTVN